MRRAHEIGRATRDLTLLTLGLAAACITPLGAQQPTDRSAPDEGPVASADLATLRSNLRGIIDDPALLRAHVGLIVIAAESGEVLFEHNAERRFTAASTTKLVTGAVALDRLGADYRWETRVRAHGTLDGGTLDGDLWVVGGGDPQLRQEELETIARSVRAAGITRVEGDLVGDDRAFAGAPWGRGWMWDDLYGSFATGVSALQLWPSRIPAEVRPGPAVGDPGILIVSDPASAPRIRAEVGTGSPGSETVLEYVPDAVDGEVALRGWIPIDSRGVRLGFAPPHPTGYFLRRFRAALEAAGVPVEGAVRDAEPNERPGRVAWERGFGSGTLGEALGRMLKYSDNQVAETLLRTVGMEAGDGSADAGLEAAERTLAGWGIDPDAVSLADGSGMSRYSELAPAALARLLRRVSQLPDFRVFLDALPISSVDGTLSTRFRSTAASRAVRAKTGSLSGVRALAGYVEDGDGETLVFALLLNGYDVPASVATALEDLLVEQLALYHGPEYPEDGPGRRDDSSRCGRTGPGDERDPAAPQPMSDADWISCERAIRIVLERVRTLGTETVPLDEAAGRALADDLISPVDHPPWDNSAMDGFAVHSDDVEGASDDAPVRLPISDDVPAGTFPSGPLERGTAVKIMTGAPVPEGATGVIRVEHTDHDREAPDADRSDPDADHDGADTDPDAADGRGGAGGDAMVTFRRASDADRNIRRRGEDIRRGDRLLERGADITPAAAALLAVAGVGRVRVGRRPRIGVLANGDELAGFEDYDEVMAGRRIMNSNGPALRAQVRAAGGEPVDLGIARDDPGSLRRRFERGASCDGIVSAAGVSVGEHDHVKAVLEEMGFERDFWRVRQRPGSATVFGLLDGRPFWGVPGNPVSAMVTFEVLVRPAIRRMAGFARTRRRPIPCRLLDTVRGPEDVLSLLRVVVTPDGSGEPAVSLTGPQGSGVLSSMDADGLLILPEGISELREGARADVLPLREWWIAAD